MRSLVASAPGMPPIVARAFGLNGMFLPMASTLTVKEASESTRFKPGKRFSHRRLCHRLIGRGLPASLCRFAGIYSHDAASRTAQSGCLNARAPGHRQLNVTPCQ